MSIRDEKRRAADAAQSAEDIRAEQAPIPLSPPSLPSRNRARNRTMTESEPAPGLIVADDSQNYNNGFLPESPELVAQEDVPPAYSEFHDQLNIHQAGFDAGAAVTGRLCLLRLLPHLHSTNGMCWQTTVGSISTSTRRADTSPIS